MKKSITESGILLFFYLSENDIDWKKCQEYTSTSLMVEVCQYKNEHPETSTHDIAIVFDTYRNTIQRYLQRGSELGICIYDKEIEKQRAHKRAIETRMKNKQKFA